MTSGFIERALPAVLLLAHLPMLGCPADNPGESASLTGTGASASETPFEATQSSSDTQASDELPPIPTLVSPAPDATEVALETELCWEPVEDPEGEALGYRVFIDGSALGEGVLGEGQGFEGPCAGPLLFMHERSYTWEVEAFELDDPTRTSGRSEVRSFSTIGDGLSEQVFADDFEQELGWELSGDAGSGHWLRGTPLPAFDGSAPSQPGLCPNSDTCFFTGQNPDGLPASEDVSGGTTQLLSPSFDLSGAAAASVRLQRFFYKSSLVADAELRVELLVPAEDPNEEPEVHLLAAHERSSMEDPEHAWRAMEYLACDLPMRAGTRLRISASDTGTGILEAAIDDVSVHAYDDPLACGEGLGSACDPELPDSCGPEQLCCSQGVVNHGEYRCEQPIAGLDFENPTESPEAPGNGPLGCDAPDLIVDTGVLDTLFTDIFMEEDTCELLEGCVGAAGWRTVMLFTVATPNVGSRDLALGVPANLPELYHYSPCHDHYHFDEFARYELRAGDEVVARGHKQAFCLLDTISWAWPFEISQFDCSNQGVSRGFSDFYESGLPCQWVDVTGVEPGDYTLRVTLNDPRPEHAMPTINERDYSNNMLEVPVTIPAMP